MKQNILVVDDNQPFLNLIKKIFDKYSDKYDLVTSNNGFSAIELIKNNVFSIIITDLQMPNMDGYTLLEKIRNNYPDIPVIVITAFDKPKTNIVVKKTGAAAYFTKPLIIDDLIGCIDNLIKKETEGGILKNASLEMFIQLIEMESKTCTIRIVNEKTFEKGVLFFKNGELFNARFLNTIGKDAAYKILAWDKVMISIENTCHVVGREITDELQAILLEALRLKDEKGATEQDFNEFDSMDDSISVNESGTVENDKEAFLLSKLKNVIDLDKDLKSLKVNNSWNNFNAQASLLGFFFNSGNHKGSYFSNYKSENLIIIPIDNDKSYEITVDLKCSPEKIINSINN